LSELNAYNTLKRRVGRGHWLRFENPATPGLPDILALVDEVYTWLEAKELRGSSKGPWRVTNLRPEQETEIWKLRNLGARVYLLLHRPTKLWLVEAWPFHIQQLVDGVEPEWLEDRGESVETVFPPRAESP
jgi:hypothetical protein